MTILRIGLVGLGMVAQVVHLPVLKALGRRFEIAALCDISEELTGKLGAEFPGARTYTDYRRMLAEGGLDIVAVVNSDEYHADCAIAALESGCHVLIEKPACLSLEDLDRIIKARDASGKQVMVGYMRRFADAYLEMAEHLGPEPKLQHVAVRDIIGPNDYFLRQCGVEVLVPKDIPAAALEERKERACVQVEAALGKVPAHHVGAYRMLCGLGSHDLSALRGLIGAPKGVLGAATKQNGLYVAAILDQGDYVATFEMGVDKVGVFDAYIEAFAGNERVRVDYDTPFLRNLPTHITVSATAEERLSVTVDRPSYRDPYTNQWTAFHDALCAGTPVATSLEDSAQDLRLFQQIIAAFPA